MKEAYDKYEINCDMGEGFGRWELGPDEAIMPLIDVANVACGFHAGDPDIMMKTVKLCKKYGVRIAAHPGTPDLKGFGRRFIDMKPEEVYNMIIYQVGALRQMCDIEGLEIESLGPHGVLYYMARSDDKILDAVCKAAVDLKLPITGTRSEFFKKKYNERGVNLLEKFFADIDWDAETGNLAHFSKWTHKTPEQVASRFTQAVLEDKVECYDGKFHSLEFNGKPFSLGIHSDLPGALESIKAARVAVNAMNKKHGYPTKEIP